MSGTDLTTFAANGGFYFQAFNEMNSLLDITTAVLTRKNGS